MPFRLKISPFQMETIMILETHADGGIGPENTKAHAVMNLMGILALHFFSLIQEHLPGNGKQRIKCQRDQQNAEKIMFHKKAGRFDAFQKKV